MSNINYDELDEITVHNQQELDDVPKNYKGHIYVDCTATVIIRDRYYWKVVAWENSTVEAWENSTVTAWENSTVEARENSTVTAWENSTVTARGNCQAVNRSLTCKINLNGNAREVFMPRNIHEYFDFYGIKHTKTTAIMYKAVRKQNGIYFSDHTSSFKYDIGKFKTENCDADTSKKCASGIHIAYLDWALRFGNNWENLAVLEVRTKIADIVMPDNCDGKVRTSKVKVLREVPLEECGVYGKILSQRRAAHG